MNSIKEIYNYRQMLISLVHKELRGKYKASALGFAWAFINPLLQLIVYTMVFSVILRANIDKYYIFLFVALVPWMFFYTSIVGGSTSVVDSGNLIKKIYFPREILPMAYVTSAFINMIIAFIVVFAVLVVTSYGLNFTAMIFLPVVMVVEYVFVLGVTFIVSSLDVYFRDISYILSVLVMAWQYMTPVMYPAEWVPEKYMFVWKLNPMTAIISAYRDILYYKRIPKMNTLMLMLFVGMFFLISGYLIFRKLQKGFAEEL